MAKKWRNFSWENSTALSRANSAGLGRLSGDYLKTSLQEAVLAVRLTSEKTLKDYLLSEGILGKTFVDFQDPLHPYTVLEIYEDREGYASIKTKREGSESKLEPLNRSLQNRELRS